MSWELKYLKKMLIDLVSQLKLGSFHFLLEFIVLNLHLNKCLRYLKESKRRENIQKFLERSNVQLKDIFVSKLMLLLIELYHSYCYYIMYITIKSIFPLQFISCTFINKRNALSALQKIWAHLRSWQYFSTKSHINILLW